MAEDHKLVQKSVSERAAESAAISCPVVFEWIRRNITKSCARWIPARFLWGSAYAKTTNSTSDSV